MNSSLYLSQSYKDAWDDYQRSLSSSVPVWDYVVLTASNEHQAREFELQMEARRAFLPGKTAFAVIPDEGGVRVGSGGATLSVLRYLREQGGWSGKRILVIHSGGDSKRVPQYSALGKLFSPVPRVLPDGRSSTLFDEFLIAMSAVPGRIREGMLLLSGDVLLLFNPLLIDWSGAGAAVISFKESVNTGRNHGVYLRGEDGNVRAFLHKQSVETLQSIGAVNDSGDVDIDTGAILLGTDVMDSLFSLISTDGSPDESKYRSFVNDTVRLSLYGDFQYPMAADSTLENFFLEKPEGEDSPALRRCRSALWTALRPYSLKLLRLAPAKFIHFGTTKEILALMSGGVDDYKELGWTKQVNCSMPAASGYNAVISSGASVDPSSYLEVSYVHGQSRVGKGCVLSYIDVYNQDIPDHVVLHGLKQSDGKFVVRIYGTEDNPKSNLLFGKKIPEEWGESLWNAPIYPEKDRIDEAVASALRLYELVTGGRWSEIEPGKSLASGFNDADPEAILAWNGRMAELVTMNRIDALIASRRPAAEASLSRPLSRVQREWLDARLARASFSEKMRLHYYVGSAIQDEQEVRKAFSSLSDAILESTLSGLRENKDARIQKDHVAIDLPLRVNFVPKGTVPFGTLGQGDNSSVTGNCVLP